MAFLWDLGRLVWLLTLLAAIVCLPAAITARTRRPSLLSLLDHFAGTALFVILAVSVLSPLRLLNPFTLALGLACWPASFWVLSQRAALTEQAVVVLRRAVVRGAVWWESRHRGDAIVSLIRTAAQEFVLGMRACGVASTTARFVVIAAAVMVAPQLIDALLNTRLAGPHAYAELVTTQQLLASELGWAVPRPFAASVAALSLASSIAPVHVVRVLLPIVGFATVVTLIITVHRLTRALGAALIAAVVLSVMSAMSGGYSRSPGNEYADVFLLLSLLFWQETVSGERKYAWAATACTVVVGLAAPAVLLVVSVAVGGMLLFPRLMLVGTGAAWLGLARFASQDMSDAPRMMDMSALANAPLAASLLFAGAFHLGTAAFRCERGARRAAIAATAAVVVALAVMPRTSAAHYVEYDAAARQSLEIAGALPKYRFLIVGPVEQWALTYGRGWHMNLFEFVDAVAANAGEPGYRLPFQVDDVFVFVETRPFAMFEREPQQVSFSVLTDPVFRHYRSLAGRSSLQFAALDICERLRETDASARIYYEDDGLRIYRFTLR